MKVTVKIDENAGLSPSEVRVKQAAEAAKREYARKWGSCPKVVLVTSCFPGANISEALQQAIKGGAL